MKLLLLLPLSSLFIVIAICSCSSADNKAGRSEILIGPNPAPYSQIDEQYESDFLEYKAQAAAKLSDNDYSIIEFKSLIEQKDGIAKQDYDKNVAELESKNSELRNNLEDYQEGSRDYWESFKAEFDYDMIALSKGFQELSAKNRR